ncbi:MAG: Ig-like domain-containing protein, partial [Tannerellaceae bacterium]|nr:Ig-like domain-containing protein [Tannerellaceae bacterium]
AIGDPTLVGAFIRHDSLFISPLKNVPAETTVKLKFNSNGKVIEKTLNVTVQPGAIENSVTGVALNRTTASLEVGKTLQLAATVAPTNADNRTVIWTSSQPLIASVDASGLVTAILAPGTVTITATTQEGGFTATCTLTTQAVSTPGIVENPFELNLQTLALAPAQTAQLALTAPQHFNTTWSSTVTSVATVTQAGLVTALAAGTTRIIARDIAQGKADTCIVTVTALPATYTLTLNTTTLSLMQGGRSTLQVVVTPQQTGGTLQWSSSNPSIADVSSSGTVIAVSPGTTLITVRLGTVSAVCAVTVTAPVSQLATSGITRTEASVAFPKASNASYYLAHVYELYSGGVKPFLTLKVTPDGEVTLRAAAGNNLVIPLSYLKPSTSYLVHLETIREKGGKSEVIKTEAVAFTTSGNATGLLSPEAVAPRVSYADGALHIEHLEGSDCILTSLHGQTVQRFHVAEVSERRFVDLPAGMYILTAVNAQQRKVFKIVVR